MSELSVHVVSGSGDEAGWEGRSHRQIVMNSSLLAAGQFRDKPLIVYGSRLLTEINAHIRMQAAV